MFHFGSPSRAPNTHCLQAHNFPFFVFSLQAASWKEIKKDSLKSFRACSLHTPDAELEQSRVDENCDIHPELTTFTEHHSEEGRAHETPRESVYCWGRNLQRSKQRQSSLWGVWTWRTDYSKVPKTLELALPKIWEKHSNNSFFPTHNEEQTRHIFLQRQMGLEMSSNLFKPQFLQPVKREQVKCLLVKSLCKWNHAYIQSLALSV